MLALVLGGGGAKGAYEIGVWRALIELDIDSKIDIAVGTSIGSLNAAFVAQRDYDKAIEMWKKFDAGKLLHVDNYKALDEKQKTISSMQNVTKDILYEGGVELTEYLETVKKYIDENLVRKSKIRYAAVTVDITNQKPVEKLLKDMKKGQLAEYITASSSLAPALKPHEIEGVKHIDGGFFDVLPINLAVKMGADEVIAVDLNATGRIRKIEQPDKIKDIKYIRSYWNLGNVLVFDEQRVHRNMMLGYLDTMKLYGAFDGNAYTFIKSSNNKGLNASAKAKYDALQLEKSSGRKLFALADKIIERHWNILVTERNKYGIQKNKRHTRLCRNGRRGSRDRSDENLHHRRTQSANQGRTCEVGRGFFPNDQKRIDPATEQGYRNHYGRKATHQVFCHRNCKRHQRESRTVGAKIGATFCQRILCWSVYRRQ